MNPKEVRIFWVISVLLTTLTFLFVAVGFIKVWTAPPPPRLGENFFLNDEEINILEKRARSERDWVSAQLLARHFDIYSRQPQEGAIWRKIAEENRKRDVEPADSSGMKTNR